MAECLFPLLYANWEKEHRLVWCQRVYLNKSKSETHTALTGKMRNVHSVVFLRGWLTYQHASVIIAAHHKSHTRVIPTLPWQHFLKNNPCAWRQHWAHLSHSTKMHSSHIKSCKRLKCHPNKCCTFLMASGRYTSKHLADFQRRPPEAYYMEIHSRNFPKSKPQSQSH